MCCACVCSGMAHWLEAELSDDWLATGLGGDGRARSALLLGSGQRAAVLPVWSSPRRVPSRDLLEFMLVPAFTHHAAQHGRWATGGRRVHRHEEPFGRLHARGPGWWAAATCVPSPSLSPGEARGVREKPLRVPGVSVAWPAASPQVGPRPLSAQLARQRQPVLTTGTGPSVPGQATDMTAQDGPAARTPVRSGRPRRRPGGGAALLPFGRSPPAATPPPRSASAAKQRGEGVSSGLGGSGGAGGVFSGITAQSGLPPSLRRLPSVWRRYGAPRGRHPPEGDVTTTLWRSAWALRRGRRPARVIRASSAGTRVFGAVSGPPLIPSLRSLHRPRGPACGGDCAAGSTWRGTGGSRGRADTGLGREGERPATRGFLAAWLGTVPAGLGQLSPVAWQASPENHQVPPQRQRAGDGPRRFLG